MTTPAADDPWFTIELMPSGRRFTAAPDQTILEAAALAGLRLPSSCRNGTCRACLCQLAAGNIRYRIAWPGLTAEEKEESWILPCVALPLSDLKVEQAHFISLTDPGNARPTRGRGF